MVSFYKERDIDFFIDVLSVPELSMKYLFQMAKGEPFVLFAEKDNDLYYTFRANQVRGPSIICNRHQEKKIRKKSRYRQNVSKNGRF